MRVEREGRDGRQDAEEGPECCSCRFWLASTPSPRSRSPTLLWATWPPGSLCRPCSTCATQRPRIPQQSTPGVPGTSVKVNFMPGCCCPPLPAASWSPPLSCCPLLRFCHWCSGYPLILRILSEDCQDLWPGMFWVVGDWYLVHRLPLFLFYPSSLGRETWLQDSQGSSERCVQSC